MGHLISRVAHRGGQKGTAHTAHSQPLHVRLSIDELTDHQLLLTLVHRTLPLGDRMVELRAALDDAQIVATELATAADVEDDNYDGIIADLQTRLDGALASATTAADSIESQVTALNTIAATSA